MTAPATEPPSAARLPDVGSPEFTADEERHYDWMRREAPVYRGRLNLLPGVEPFFLARYDDCLALLTDRRFARHVAGAPPLPVPRAIRFLTEDSLIFKDDPEHLRLRRLVSKPFTRGAVARLGTRVEALTAELLDGLAGRDEVDLQAEYALPIPVTVINEMVGVPEQDRERFREWMVLLTEGVAVYGLEEAGRRMEGLVEYLRELIDRRRADPGDDIMTGLITAAEGGDTLSDDELVAMVFTLAAAGHETTYHLITNGVATLLQHDDQLALLRERPELMESAVEEILRYAGPVGGTEPNYATQDVELHGVTIPAGAMAIPLLGSANRDPAAFEDPQRFDIARDPNHHLAFGEGRHFCLGASLARMETRVALAALLRRHPHLRLAVDPGELRRSPLPLSRRLEGLPVVLGR